MLNFKHNNKNRNTATQTKITKRNTFKVTKNDAQVVQK